MWLRRAGIAIAFCVCTLGSARDALAAERFQMAMFHNSDPEYGDLEWINLSSPGKRNGQSDSGRHGILLLNYAIEKFDDWSGPDPQTVQALAKYLRDQKFEWHRIDAVLVDEAFWGATAPSWENPCNLPERDSPRYRNLQRMQRYVANIAAAVRQVAPRETRFWVNFSEPEMRWIREKNCPQPLNDWYMDVVSIDLYQVPFKGHVKPHYDWLFANRATPYQQLALIPGTFRVYGRKVVGATRAASWLQQYFDYAHEMNSSCTLPIGRVGVTGKFDGCPVWVVAGFWADGNHHSDRGEGIHWVSLRDPSSRAIEQSWTKQLRIPRKAGSPRS
jgi:hypothetical protein